VTKRPWIIAGLVSVGLFLAGSLTFAANYPRRASDAPPYVLTDAVLQLLNTTHVSELVALRLNRGDLSALTIKALGAVVWLPFLIGCTTFVILMLLYEHLKLDILWPAAFVVIAVILITCFAWVTFGGIIILGAVLFPVFAAKASDKPRWGLAFNIAISTLLFFSAIALSFTTHILLTSYSGFRPASQVEPAELRTLFGRLTNEAVPADAGDAVSWHLNQIPSLNASRMPMTIFAVNRLAAIGFIVSTTLYLVVVWVLVIPAEGRRPATGRLPRNGQLLRRLRGALKAPTPTESYGGDAVPAAISPKPFKRLFAPVAARGTRSAAQLPHWARVAFAVPFYLSVGIAFAILYFNIYIAAAAKQNVMLLYADFMQISDDEYTQLLAARESFGPTESLVKRMLDVTRERTDKDISRTLYAARARYWPSAVVAQELPRVTVPIVKAPNGGKNDSAEAGGDEQSFPTAEPPETQLVLDPQLTFTDMLYFSFVSFTTTGYGDIRPISDELRLWTVCENIIEVLFTAMFFVVAMEPQR
jgi:hypothetical protein